MWCCYLPAVLLISVFESTFWRGAGVETSIQNQCMALEGYICTHTQPSTLLISCTLLPRCIEENNRFLPICLSAQDLTFTKLNTFPTRTKVKWGKPFHSQSCHFSAVGPFQISSWFCAQPNLKKSLKPEHSTKPHSQYYAQEISVDFFSFTHTSSHWSASQHCPKELCRSWAHAQLYSHLRYVSNPHLLSGGQLQPTGCHHSGFSSLNISFWPI